MAMVDNEEEQVRAVALQNAQSILAARRRVEEELQKQSERLRITLASIGDGVISTDADSRIVFMNGVAETLTGWSQDEGVEAFPDRESPYPRWHLPLPARSATMHRCWCWCWCRWRCPLTCLPTWPPVWSPSSAPVIRDRHRRWRWR